MPTATRKTKGERIELRVSPEAKALLSAAADVRHTTVSEFLLRHGVEAAEQALATPHIFYATEAGWTSIQQLLSDEPTPPSPDTAAWLRKSARIR